MLVFLLNGQIHTIMIIKKTAIPSKIIFIKEKKTHPHFNREKYEKTAIFAELI